MTPGGGGVGGGTGGTVGWGGAGCGAGFGNDGEGVGGGPLRETGRNLLSDCRRRRDDGIPLMSVTLLARRSVFALFRRQTAEDADKCQGPCSSLEVLE